MANCSLYLNSTGKVSNGKIQRPEKLKKKKKKQWTVTYLGHQNTFINKELLGKSYHNFS